MDLHAHETEREMGDCFVVKKVFIYFFLNRKFQALQIIWELEANCIFIKTEL